MFFHSPRNIKPFESKKKKRTKSGRNSKICVSKAFFRHWETLLRKKPSLFKPSWDFKQILLKKLTCISDYHSNATYVISCMVSLSTLYNFLATYSLKFCKALLISKFPEVICWFSVPQVSKYTTDKRVWFNVRKY